MFASIESSNQLTKIDRFKFSMSIYNFSSCNLFNRIQFIKFAILKRKELFIPCARIALLYNKTIYYETKPILVLCCFAVGNSCGRPEKMMWKSIKHFE